jgi:hypothetical protein
MPKLMNPPHRVKPVPIIIIVYILQLVYDAARGVAADKKIVQGRSGNALCCPIQETVRRIKHHWLKNSTPSAPLASYYLTKRRTAIKAMDVTDTLRHAMMLNFHRIGIKAADISTRSLCAGGAMAMFFGKIDINNIHFMGRWHSDAMMRYLHLLAQPLVGRFAEVMYNNGAYIFQPDETVPIIDT